MLELKRNLYSLKRIDYKIIKAAPKPISESKQLTYKRQTK